MSIKLALNSDYPELSVAEAMNHTRTTMALTRFLRSCDRSIEVLPLLAFELKNKNRLSYVDRMYGRYHLLLRREAYKEMNEWAKQNRK